jgi:hypothetical protein
MGRYRTDDYTTTELAYICKFYEYDGPSRLGMALNRSPKTISQTVRKLKKSDKYEFYKKLWDRLCEKGA